MVLWQTIQRNQEFLFPASHGGIVYNSSNQEFEDSLGYMGRPCLKPNQTKQSKAKQSKLKIKNFYFFSVHKKEEGDESMYILYIYVLCSPESK
jgi:hypothetical protein